MIENGCLFSISHSDLHSLHFAAVYSLLSMASPMNVRFWMLETLTDWGTDAFQKSVRFSGAHSSLLKQNTDCPNLRQVVDKWWRKVLSRNPRQVMEKWQRKWGLVLIEFQLFIFVTIFATRQCVRNTWLHTGCIRSFSLLALYRRVPFGALRNLIRLYISILSNLLLALFFFFLALGSLCLIGPSSKAERRDYKFLLLPL